MCSDMIEGVEAVLAQDGEHLAFRMDETNQKQRKFIYVNPTTQSWTLVVYSLEASQNLELPTARVADYSYCIVQSGNNFVQLQPEGE